MSKSRRLRKRLWSASLVALCGFALVAVLPSPASATPTPTRPSWLPANVKIIRLHSLSELPGAKSTKPLYRAGLTDLSSAATGTAAANTIYDYSAVQNQRDSQCLDGDRNTIPANGTKVQLWNCNGYSNQDWYFTPTSAGTGTYFIRSDDQGQCLDGDTHTMPANGAIVQLWSCSYAANQVWIISNALPITNYSYRQCLDGDTNTMPANGTKVQLWACNGQSQQNWLAHQYA